MGFTARLAHPEAFGLQLSVDYVAMIIVGGWARSGIVTWRGVRDAAARSDSAGGEIFNVADMLSAATRNSIRPFDHCIFDLRAPWARCMARKLKDRLLAFRKSAARGTDCRSQDHLNAPPNSNKTPKDDQNE